MNFSHLSTVISILILSAASAFAYPVQEGDYVKFSNGQYGTTAGGEFNLHKYNTGTQQYEQLAFTTFCLEYNEHIDYSSTFKADSISDRAYGGGPDRDDAFGDGDGDQISASTQWLYWNFVNGTLEAATNGLYTYGDAGIDTLQTAIWLIEDEISVSDVERNLDKYSSALNLAATADMAIIRASLEDYYSAGVDSIDSIIGNVKVMNISFLDGRHAQSQLIAGPAPVPEPSTWALLGIGLAGLVFYRRRER